MSDKRIITKGGYKAALINNQIIRLSDDPKRIVSDGETFDEYKVRLKLIKKMKKKVVVKLNK
jgi:hypothetical protein